VVVNGTVALRTDTGEELGELEPGASLDVSTLQSGAVAVAGTNVVLIAALP
jgi:hypothetical protein